MCVSFGFFCLVVFCLVVCGVFLFVFWVVLGLFFGCFGVFLVVVVVCFLVHYTAGLCSSLTPQGSTTIHIINN